MTESKQPTEIFRYFREIESRTLQYQFTIASWVIGSAFLLNGGALIAMLGIVDKRPQVVGAGGPFVIGLILAVTCGLLVWFNTVSVGEAVTDRLDWAKLDIIDPASADIWDKRAVRLAVAAMASLVLSIVSFGYGALSLEAALDREAKHRAAPVTAQHRQDENDRLARIETSLNRIEKNQQAQLPAPMSKEQYDQMPKGTTFLAPDGTIRRKVTEPVQVKD